MSAHRDDHLDLCAGYALGSLTADESCEFQAHLDSGCDVCAAEVREHESAVSLLASAAPPHRAPAALRSRVLDAVQAEMSADAAERPVVRTPRAPLPMPERARPSYFGWTWAAAAAVLAVVGFMQWQSAQQLQSQLAARRCSSLARSTFSAASWLCSCCALCHCMNPTTASTAAAAAQVQPDRKSVV